ncbi:MAG: FapA family protein [Butyricicoccus sp.]|nr:FapA family protein [Butyricicoccus sp.]
MAFAKKIFSRFFGQNTEQPMEQPVETTEKVPETPLPSPFDVDFPPDHALCKLRALWSGQEETSGMRVNLLPDERKAFPISIDKITFETALFKMALTRITEQRLRQGQANAGSILPSNLDALPFVYLSCDHMVAWLMLLPPIGQGREVTAEQIEQALEHYSVSYGINKTLLHQLPSNPQRYFQLFAIAYGAAAVHGRDGYIIDHYPRVMERPTPVKELSQADYITLNLVQDVDKGDVICDIVPATRGVAGKTVMGKPIPAQDGSAAVVPKGRNTAISENGEHLIATRPGHVEFSGRNFQVKPVLEILENVDASTGSINFLGDVHIHGDVRKGFTVRAIGNIQIDGVIEACTVEAGENLVVSSGVQGQDYAVIRAHKNIYAKYLEHCSAYARESVQADCIIGCNIYSDGYVRARTGRGTIIGGTIRAAKEVWATTVGSKAETLTSVILGGLPCEGAERAQIQEDLQKTEQEIARLEMQPEEANNPSKLSELRLNVCVAKMKLDKFDKEFAAQVEEQSGEDKRRMICDAAYPGTVVTIGHEGFRIDKVEHDCIIGLVNGSTNRI